MAKRLTPLAKPPANRLSYPPFRQLAATIGDMTDGSSRYTGPNVQVAPHSSPYPTRRLDPAISLVDTAAQIAQASNQIAHQTHAQLTLIHQQIQELQAQAREILDKAARDVELHRAECRFTRVPGQRYHLYRRPDGVAFFSMLSPEDYGGSPPHTFVGSYWLEADRTWTEDGAPRKNLGSVDLATYKSLP